MRVKIEVEEDQEADGRNYTYHLENPECDDIFDLLKLYTEAAHLMSYSYIRQIEAECKDGSVIHLDMWPDD